MADTVQRETIELALVMPHMYGTKFHIRISFKTKAALISLAAVSPDEIATAASLGSFVYALPDRYNEKQPLATALYSHEPSLEFTTRVAKHLVRKLGMPVYVTNSISFANAGMGGSVEEEMDAFKAIVQAVLNASREAGVARTVDAIDGLALQ